MFVALMPLRSMHLTLMGRFPFHSYRCQSTVTSVTPTLQSTVCPSYGIVVIGSQDSSHRWSGDVWPDKPSRVSAAESRCNLAQCMLEFLQI